MRSLELRPASVTGVAGGLDDQVALADPGPRGRAAVLDLADEQPVPLGEADRPAEPAGDAAGATATPSRGRLDRLAAAERVDPLAQGGVGRAARGRSPRRAGSC